jgi:hypothetical protein
MGEMAEVDKGGLNAGVAYSWQFEAAGTIPKGRVTPTYAPHFRASVPVPSPSEPDRISDDGEGFLPCIEGIRSHPSHLSTLYGFAGCNT